MIKQWLHKKKIDPNSIFYSPSLYWQNIGEGVMKGFDMKKLTETKKLKAIVKVRMAISKLETLKMDIDSGDIPLDEYTTKQLERILNDLRLLSTNITQNKVE